MKDKKIVIIGAGPTGLGAAYRLTETGYDNWTIYEKNDYVGGLSASFYDDKGFTWDVGGHVLFSHFSYFDQIVETALKGKYLEHERRSFIRVKDRWVPYPFQNNLRYLPKEMLYDCLTGLMEASNRASDLNNFKDWIKSVFGEGISNCFMYPYNKKVWAHSLKEMSADWIAERVSLVDFNKVLKNVIFENDDVSWGPNNKFKFPLKGGTGAIFTGIEKMLGKNVRFNSNVTLVDVKKKEIIFSNGESEKYDALISTMPLHSLACNMQNSDIREVSDNLKSNSGFIVGIGISGEVPDNKCWMYFPEDSSPFYRVTYFSNYSPNNVPADNPHYSLMCETSYSKYKIHKKGEIIEDTITGLINSGLISEEDQGKIVSKYLINIDNSYPVPTLKLRSTLKSIQNYLRENSIYSRGRFGGFKYEVGNMDHSFMQGVEAVDNILLKKEETVYRVDN